jgi:uncharacterized protein (TIRG00374 family)
MAAEKRSIRRLILLFTLITICVIVTIAFLTAGAKTWHALRVMRIRYMLLACGLGAMYISLDGMILKILSKSVGTKIGFFYSLETICFYHFLSAITPTITGGEPLMIYMLTRKKMPLGKATSVILIRGILILSIIVIAAPIIIYCHGVSLNNIILKNLFHIIAIFLFLLICFFIYTLFNPLKGEEIIHRICLKAGRFKFLGHWSEKLEKKLEGWIGDFINCMKDFFKYKKKILCVAILLTVISASANYLIAYFILESLNYHLQVLQILMIQVVLYFLLYFTPTPGGTGVAEGGFYVMFSASVPRHLLGIFVILWRFFTIYLWVILGGILITKTIGLDILDKLSQ